MRRSAILLAATAALSFGISQAAYAADMPVKAPIYTKAPPAIVLYNWSGCYVGVEGGGNWGRSQHFAETGGTTFAATNKFNMDGWLVGGTVGCNVQLPPSRFVFGIESDWSWTNKEGGAFDIAPFNTNFFSQTKENWIATFRGRLGYAAGATGNWLFYVTGGAALADIEINVDGPRPASTTFGSQTNNRWGWTVGGGVEWGIAPYWSVKAEYLYVDFGKDSYFCPTPPPNLATRCGGIDVTDHIVRVGLNYRFHP